LGFEGSSVDANLISFTAFSKSPNASRQFPPDCARKRTLGSFRYQLWPSPIPSSSQHGRRAAGALHFCLWLPSGQAASFSRMRKRLVQEDTARSETVYVFGNLATDGRFSTFSVHDAAPRSSAKSSLPGRVEHGTSLLLQHAHRVHHSRTIRRKQIS